MAFNLYDPKTPKIKRGVSAQTLAKIRQYLTYTAIGIGFVLLVWITVAVWPKTPSLTIECKVPAEIFLDDKSYGKGSTVFIRTIEPGRHVVKAVPLETIPFMDMDVQKVDISPGRSETIELINVSDVVFDTKPQKAAIILSSLEGDASLGTTPLRTKLPYGQYDVVMRLPGFPEYQKSFLSSGAEVIDITADFDELALNQPGSRKLTTNLSVPKLIEGAKLTVDGKEYAQGSQTLLPSGFHKVCMNYYNQQILCTQVMFPSVGKPIEISWPETIYNPCMYFGRDLFTLPGDARGATVAQDGSSLLYATGYPFVDCVDLESGQRVWTQKIDRAFDLRPVIIYKTDGNNIYGMAGIPSDPRSTPFCIEIKTGKEIDVQKKFEGSILPLATQPFKSDVWNCYGNVWETVINGEGKVAAIEAVVVKNLETFRYVRRVESDETARFLGVSFSATDDGHPIFIFSLKRGKTTGIMVLDPTLAIPHKLNEYKERNREKYNALLEGPQGADAEKGWIWMPLTIDAQGACFDAGFNTGKTFIVYSDFTVAAVMYPQGRYKWSRYVDKARKSDPTISRSKGKDVVLINFPTSPFEYQLDLKTGEQIERRVKPQTAEEAIQGLVCPGGSFVLPGNKAISGVKLDDSGKFKPTWERTFKTGLLLPSPWGPVQIESNKVTVLGSHMLRPILKLTLPGLGSPKNGLILGDKRFLALFFDGRIWIIDRDGLNRGYFTGIDGLEPLESSGHRAMLANMDGKKVVIPWPQN